MMIGIVIVFLINHLLRIQVPERLAYIKDYQDFTLSVIEVEDCTNEVYSFFQKDNVIYNGVCIRDVYVNYGKTQAPLKLVLDEKYITLKDIQKKLSQHSSQEVALCTTVLLIHFHLRDMIVTEYCKIDINICLCCIS